MGASTAEVDNVLDRPYLIRRLKLRYEPALEGYLCTYPAERLRSRLMTPVSAAFVRALAEGLTPRQAARRLATRFALPEAELETAARQTTARMIALGGIEPAAGAPSEAGPVGPSPGTGPVGPSPGTGQMGPSPGTGMGLGGEEAPSIPRAGRLARPWRAQVAICQQCDLRCRHCYATRDERCMSLADFAALVGTLDRLGVHELEIVGGEPLLHPDLEAMITLGLEAGLSVRVFTNAQTFTPARIARLAPLVRFCVGIHGNPGYHDSFAGREGVSAKARAAVRDLMAAGGAVSILSSINYENIDDVPGLVEFARAHGAQAVCLPTIPAGRAVAEFDLDLRRCMRTTARLTQMTRRFMATGAPVVEPSFAKPRDFNCEGGRGFLFVGVDLQVYSCPLLTGPEFRVGHALRDDLGQLWRTSPVFDAFSRTGPSSLEPCATCDEDMCLYGCKATVHSLTGSIDEPPPHCPRVFTAERRRRVGAAGDPGRTARGAAGSRETEGGTGR